MNNEFVLELNLKTLHNKAAFGLTMPQNWQETKLCICRSFSKNKPACSHMAKSASCGIIIHKSARSFFLNSTWLTWEWSTTKVVCSNTCRKPEASVRVCALSLFRQSIPVSSQAFVLVSSFSVYSDNVCVLSVSVVSRDGIMNERMLRIKPILVFSLFGKFHRQNTK